MLYAVELYFNKETEEKIMRLPQGLAEKGLSTRYLEWKTRPHITLGLFNNIDLEKCDKLLKEFAKEVTSLPAHLSSIGIFNNSRCIFLSPVVTRELLQLHLNFHNIFSFCDHSGYEYYLPDSWVPHCAVMLGDSDNDNDFCESAKHVIENYGVLHGLFSEISFVEITMPVKEHTAHKLQEFHGNSIYTNPEDFSIRPTQAKVQRSL
jgi:2'-5' RNA ligase